MHPNDHMSAGLPYLQEQAPEQKDRKLLWQAEIGASTANAALQDTWRGNRLATHGPTLQASRTTASLEPCSSRCLFPRSLSTLGIRLQGFPHHSQFGAHSLEHPSESEIRLVAARLLSKRNQCLALALDRGYSVPETSKMALLIWKR